MTSVLAKLQLQPASTCYVVALELVAKLERVVLADTLDATNTNYGFFVGKAPHTLVREVRCLV